MIKKIIMLIILVSSLTILTADLYISGFNQAEFIHRTAEDSLKNYFENELGLVVDYNNLSFGITFNAYLPKYDDDAPLDELRSSDLAYEWDERYLTYNADNIGLKVGTLSESFGTGMTFRAYENEDLDHDNRLEGAMTTFQYDRFKSKAIYGVSANSNNPENDDTFAGAEFSLSHDYLTWGGSAIQIREMMTTTSYSNRQVYSSNLNLFFDFMDIYGEYAYTELEQGIRKYGHGIYANSNFYLGSFTFSAYYKKFKNFNYSLNDLPTLNHADDILYEDKPVQDEEGGMGELTWDNAFARLFGSYAEAWSSDYNYRLSNGFIETSKELGDNLLTLSYEHFERKNRDDGHWSKEFTPTASIDIPLENNLSLYLKGAYTMNEEQHNFGDTENFVEPLLQTDLMYQNYALSLVAEAQMEDLSSISDAEYWVGATLSASLVDNTSLNLFVGKQKGGKLCQNGTCKEVKPFEGVKIEITTKF